MATKKPLDKKEQEKQETIKDIKNLDNAVRQLMKDNIDPLAGGQQSSELNSIYDEFSTLIKSDSYNFMKSKSNGVSSYNYLASSLMGKHPSDKKSMSKKEQIESRLNMERIFQNGDSQAAAIFLNQSSDIQHICDEIESVCAYLHELDEAVYIFRDNIMNSEQSMAELPFDVMFDMRVTESVEYQKTITDAVKESGILQKLNDHIVPKTIKYGRYYVLTIPYSEIGIRMIDNKITGTRGIFDFTGAPTGGGPLSSGIHESASGVDKNFECCMENVDILLDALYADKSIVQKNGITEDRDALKTTIEYNLGNLLVNDDSTPPNITGIQESTFGEMDDEMKKLVDKALKDNFKKFNTTAKFNGSKRPEKNEDKSFMDATIDAEALDSVPGCFIKLVDPRQIVPIKIFDHVLGYYYFENYDYARIGTSITDILSNDVNFNDQNLVIDNIVGSVLRTLKYGDLLKGDDNFKSLVLNCVLYAERRQNPVRMKFVPVDYVTEFKTNCDENGNGQPLLLKSLVYGRLYVSLLLFIITTIVTKSTDTEFYYLKDGLITSSYEEQVADIIEQFRNSNIDISQIINGDLLHGNRAVNKRYFMCTGTQDQKPFDMEVISGQQIDTHTDLLDTLKKAAIGSIGIPALALDYQDEIEFATIAKMSNQKTAARSNNIQTDLDPSVTELVKKIVHFSKPNAIPDDVMDTMGCAFRKVNTINANISSDELNNNIATVDNMIETIYGGQNTETPPTVEFEKEEVRKRMIMKMSPSLPWGYLESVIKECKLDGKLKEAGNKIKAESSDTTGE